MPSVKAAARTTLADFFSILQLKHEFDADGPQVDIGMICPLDGEVKIACDGGDS